MEDIEENDYEHTISLFELLNIIIEELISRPKKISTYYKRLPKSQEDQIEKRNNIPKDD